MLLLLLPLQLRQRRLKIVADYDDSGRRQLVAGPVTPAAVAQTVTVVAGCGGCGDGGFVVVAVVVQLPADDGA